MKYLYFILISILLFSGCPATAVHEAVIIEDSAIPVYFTTNGTAYYVTSSSGDDSNSGLLRIILMWQFFTNLSIRGY